MIFLSYDIGHSGEEVCVSCESKASRPHLGNRCSGHGVDNKLTRFAKLIGVNKIIFVIGFLW